jgi:hypothetical protein
MCDENLPLEEWKAALENARSFNTLLLQLRGFGIPIVITIMGGGVAFASKIDIPTIPVKGASIILIIIAFVLLVVVYAIYVAAKDGGGGLEAAKAAGGGLEAAKAAGGGPEVAKAAGGGPEVAKAAGGGPEVAKAVGGGPEAAGSGTELTGLEIFEGAILCLVPILGLGIGLCCYRADFFGNAFAVSSPGVMGTMLFALSLLLGLYGIDRCYYYKLLIGAVKRADELERKLGFSLTRSISTMTPLKHSKNFITTMYWLPALGALMVVVTLGYLKLWTGHNEAMSGGLIKCLQDLLK